MEKYDILEKQYRLLEIYNIDLENENKKLNTRIDFLERENQILQEQNDSLKRENDAYYDNSNTPKTYNEKEIKKLKEIIQILLD